MRRLWGEEESGKTPCDTHRPEWLELFGSKPAKRGQWEEESWKCWGEEGLGGGGLGEGREGTEGGGTAPEIRPQLTSSSGPHVSRGWRDDSRGTRVPGFAAAGMQELPRCHLGEMQPEDGPL